MNRIKKMPISISFGDIKVTEDEFLVPNSIGDGSLVGIKNGKEYLYGAISFIGVEVTVTDIINKMLANKIDLIDISGYEKILNNYFDEIDRFKISNIIFSSVVN